MTLPIPTKALEQHVITLGKTGAGKSSALRVLVEHLLEHDKPVCIIDPKGDWFGIKSSADGKQAGYPVVIFGGEHADVPINEHSGAHVAELVAGGNRPCLIDLGGWMVGERTRFFIAFASHFFKHARGLRHLVIDEVHNFAPQGKVLDVDAGKMLHWTNRLASEGRGKGITLLAASQRPQKVHKDFVTSCETLIAMRVTHPLDRGAVKDWMDGCADPTKSRELVTQLASMKRGEAIVWSPEIDFGPKHVTFPMFTTYDSFKPQTAVAKLQGWAEVDLEEVRTKLATVVAEAQANDPALLKKRIRELEAAARKPGPDPTITHSVKAPGPDAGQIRELRRRAELLERNVKALQEYSEGLFKGVAWAEAILEQLSDALGEFRQVRFPRQPKLVEIASPPVSPNAPAVSRNRPPVPQSRSSVSPRAAPDGLNKGEALVLTAIAQFEAAGVEREQLFVLTGYKSRSIDTYITRLRQFGFIGTTWPVVATEAGIEALGASFEPLPTGDRLREYWLNKLPDGEKRMLEALVSYYPTGMTKQQLGDLTNYKGRSVDTYIGRLKARRVVEKRGTEWFVSEALFG